MKRFRLRVLLVLAAAALALGVANDFRVFKERRVSILGYTPGK